MENKNNICYVFIPDFKCLHNTELNLHKSYSFHYDCGEKVLTGKYIDRLPSNFWGAGISSISAIVGGNGAGKSTALRWLVENITDGNVNRQPDGIIVYTDNEGRLCVYRGKSFGGVKVALENIEGNSVSDNAPVPEINLILYKGNFELYMRENTWHGELKGEKNISDSWLLINDLQSYQNDPAFYLHLPIGNYLNAYYYQNNLRICNFLLNCDKWNFAELYSPPRFIYIEPNTCGENRLLAMANDKRSPIDIIEKLSVPQATADVRTNAISEYIGHGIMNFIAEFALQDEALRDAYIDFWNRWVAEWNSLVNNDIAVSFESFAKNERSAIKAQVLDIAWIVKELNSFCFAPHPYNGGLFYIDTTDTKGTARLRDLLDNQLRRPRFITARYFDLVYAHELFGESQLSSGELHLLNLLSRIYDVTYIKGHYAHLILLDEAENAFHPEWQRRYIEILKRFFSALPVPPQHRFQIIYTTHSPISLSDMPGFCVNYIGPNAQKSHQETFGANVFDLYRDSFFLDNGLIGSFAAEHINRLSKLINEFTTLDAAKREEAQRLLDILGDDRLRNYFEHKLNIAMRECDDIALLRRRINELEAKRQKGGYNEES